LKAILNADGGARGNPGPAGIGVVLTNETGEVIGEIAQGIGQATNNVAEYSAVIAGLELALEKGVTDIEVRVDTELVASQIQGKWKIKNDRLRQLAVRARGLLNQFESWTIAQVPREENAGADALANQGMDAAEVLGTDPLPDQPGFLE
jgi:probable phosphoglycerate mutase